MNIIRSISVGFFCAAIFSVAVIGQTGAQPVPSKVAIVNSFLFGDEKAGIAKLVTATKRVNTEFTPVQNELQSMSARLQTLANEIDALRKNPVADSKALQAKIDEAAKLEREFKYKQEDAKARYDRRQQAEVGPVMQAIGKGLLDFAKQKGYILIFDIAKDETGLLIAIGDERADVTKEFIAFYNARP